MDFKKFFKDKIILVCGGTGSIGIEIVSQLLKYNPRTIRILTNSENELWNAKIKFEESKNKLRFLLGDIRNYRRMERATEGVDYVFNAGAIKHVPISEYNPLEAISVNIYGLENIIQASFKNDVKKVIQISTDKAINPSTVMGATKMLGERLAISRQIAKGKSDTIISCVRFGNVLGSRGSIIPLLKRQIREGNYVTLTNEKMKRFFLSISQAVKLVLKAIILAQGGEIFVLKMPTILIKDLMEIIIEEYAPTINKKPENIRIKVIGARLKEKINEALISPHEFTSCYELKDMYIIYPDPKLDSNTSHNEKNRNAAKIILDEKFHYSTEMSPLMLKEELRDFLLNLNLI